MSLQNPTISPDEDDLSILLTRRNLTARELASKLGVTESWVSKWVNGRVPLPVRWIPGLAKNLGRSEEQIRRAYEVGKVRFRRGKVSDSVAPRPRGRPKKQPPQAQATAIAV
jgi:transcriptional regulator with XRE-family HTH domain